MRIPAVTASIPAPDGARHPDPSIATLVGLFETLSPASLDRLAERYAEQARFKDPFNDVHGRAAVRRVYAHMFEALQSPRFAIHRVVGGGPECALTWDLDFAFRGRALRIHGASLLRLDAEGRIADHRDYWDTGEELYAKLPLIGAPVRWLQRRLSTPPA